MRPEDIVKYKALCDKMGDLPGSLRAALADFGSIGCQLFIPYGVCAFLGEKSHISEASWRKFREANDGRIAKAISGWEKWEMFPEALGCLRYFGQGDQEALQAAKKVFALGKKRLNEFEELGVPEETAWSLPNIWICDGACRLMLYHSLPELICRQVGEEDSSGILLEDAELPVVERKNNLDDFFGGTPSPPTRFQEVGLEMLAVDDLTSALEDAIKVWIPDDIIDRIASLVPPPWAEAQHQKPSWNGHTLMYRGRVIKRFTNPAKNQKRVLSAFEEQGWPEGITDPIPGLKGGTHAYMSKRVSDTVDGLNDDHVTPGLIRFEADGHRGYRWRRVK
jgi:hypothetical protein